MLVKNCSLLGFSDIVGGWAGGSYIGHGQTMNSTRKTVQEYKSWVYSKMFWKRWKVCCYVVGDQMYLVTMKSFICASHTYRAIKDSKAGSFLTPNFLDLVHLQAVMKAHLITSSSRSLCSLLSSLGARPLYLNKDALAPAKACVSMIICVQSREAEE